MCLAYIDTECVRFSIYIYVCNLQRIIYIYVSLCDISAKGVGGTSGGGGGGSSLTIAREKQKLTNKVQVVGARRVWGIYNEGDYNLVPEIGNAKVLSPKLFAN